MILKFRKKPVVIDAIQFYESTRADVYVFLGEDWESKELNIPHMDHSERGTFKIKTLEGVMTANEGDWIIKGLNGEFYPCKPDIFEKTYERVI